MTHPVAATHPPAEHPGWITGVKNRWPVWLAIAMTAVSWGSSSRESLSDAILLFAFGYLAAAVLQRRQASWVVAATAIGGLAALRLQDRVDPSAVLLAAALALVVWATLRGRMWPPGDLMLETAGMVGFAALALAALTVDRDLGRYLLAAGWLGHAAWDVAHWRANRVVSRSFAEWCAVYDTLGAVAILLLPVL